MPDFLKNNGFCTLLNDIKLEVLNPGQAGRAITSAKDTAIWRDVERWLLIAEAGALTVTHQDSLGWETFITVSEEEIGFSWLDTPTAEILISWAKDPRDFRGGK